jgi:hypothetical protein
MTPETRQRIADLLPRVREHLTGEINDFPLATLGEYLRLADAEERLGVGAKPEPPERRLEIVEVFGHKSFAGFVTEVIRAGAPMIRVEIANDVGFDEILLSPKAIFSRRPITTIDDAEQRPPADMRDDDWRLAEVVGNFIHEIDDTFDGDLVEGMAVLLAALKGCNPFENPRPRLVEALFSMGRGLDVEEDDDDDHDDSLGGEG